MSVKVFSGIDLFYMRFKMLLVKTTKLMGIIKINLELMMNPTWLPITTLHFILCIIT